VLHGGLRGRTARTFVGVHFGPQAERKTQHSVYFEDGGFSRQVSELGLQWEQFSGHARGTSGSSVATNFQERCDQVAVTGNSIYFWNGNRKWSPLGRDLAATPPLGVQRMPAEARSRGRTSRKSELGKF
jgi:hypothetical protein